MNSLARILLLVILSFLSGCSNTYQHYANMAKQVFKTPTDITLTYSTIVQAKNDFLYVRLGENSRIAMGLMAVDGEQMKWLSADQSVLVTDHGRIIKTLGLSNDLLYVSNLLSDPLKWNSLNNSAWIRAVDWHAGEYGYQIRSKFSVQQDQLTFFTHSVNTIKVIETLEYDNPASFWRFDQQWQNVFWLEAKTGQVLKSKQQLQPGAQPFELVFISEVVRHLNREGLFIAEDAI
ncbi:YjbF family lipoprotein [Alishewanella sp. HL-SH06]|uniref:YjbF family lipoprotein n=1 Tax=Alishewanella sp. HL-SH06 TaxID=3461144 RepID=UPI004041CCF2